MQAWILVHCSRKNRKSTRSLDSDHFSFLSQYISSGHYMNPSDDTSTVFLPIIILPAEPLDTFKVPVSQSGKPANRKNGLAVCASVMGNSPFTSFCFHDSTVTVVDCYMSGIADDITCFCFGQTGYCLSKTSPSCGCCISTTLCSDNIQNLIYKVRTVNTIGQRISTPYIWVANKLIGISYDSTSGYSAAACGTAGAAGACCTVTAV